MSKHNIKINIIDDNLEICNILSDYFENVNDIEVCNISHNGVDGVTNLEKYKPDILVLDLIMPELDGLGVLNYLKTHNIDTKVIVVTAINKDFIAQESFSLGSYYYMLKPFRLSVLEERIRSIYDFGKTNYNLQASQTESVEAKIIRKLLYLGVPTNILGYQYIIDAVKMIVNNDTPLLLKNIYQELADKNITTISCVESAIRNAILQASNKNKENFINLFSQDEGRPTNSQFITKISQDIKINSL